MIATSKVLVDGQWYNPGEEIWDLGSFYSSDPPDQKQRGYYGLSKDVSKLPHYVLSGSSAICVDTGDLYLYLKDTDTWYKQ